MRRVAAGDSWHSANLVDAELSEAKCSAETKWLQGSDPKAAAVLVEN
jgi:hypothetical protein|tara:strand:+ start:75 stop:215 length:141 start_codon:yes stop_codon:yes gene_type:complete